MADMAGKFTSGARLKRVEKTIFVHAAALEVPAEDEKRTRSAREAHRSLTVSGSEV